MSSTALRCLAREQKKIANQTAPKPANQKSDLYEAISKVIAEEEERTDSEDEGESQKSRFRKKVKRTTEAVLAAIAPFV